MVTPMPSMAPPPEHRERLRRCDCLCSAWMDAGDDSARWHALPLPLEDAGGEQQGRAVCSRCGRPSAQDCLCSALPEQPLRCQGGTVIVLQHPLESRRTLATVPLLAACLTVHVIRGRKHRAGRSAVLDDAIAAASLGERPLFVLWPGSGSLDVHSVSPPVSWTLVAFDGTWPQAAEMARSFLPVLCGPGTLVQLSAAVNDQSLMLRSEPAAGHVLTAEAVARAAAALEAAAIGDAAAAELLSTVLAPLRLLVALQRRRDTVGKGVKAAVT